MSITVEEAIEAIEQILEQKHLSKVQEIVFRQSWEGQSYAEIARSADYDPGYIKDTGSKLWQLLSEAFGKKVTKQNFRGVLKQAARQHSTVVHPSKSTLENRIDWGEAIDASVFYGRTEELATLQHWVTTERCRLVTLLGMGGMGKTTLSVKLAELVQEAFNTVIWRSLRDAPSLTELLTTLIKFLSNQQDFSLPECTGEKLSCLIELLRESRCLLILDNFDAVLQSGKAAGTYRPEYEGYGELLKRVGEIAHQSCVVLTSREKPQEISALEGEALPVRSLSLLGVDAIAGQNILRVKGLVSELADTITLVEHYQGNPLALKIAATSIRDLFAGDIAQFLDQGTVAFSGISNLLKQQVDRLSDLETQVMDWLAIHREPVFIAELRTDLVPEPSCSKLMAVLESLQSRSLIVSSTIGFTLQPVLMETITEWLIERVSDEIITESPHRLLTHALVKAQAKDYIRDSQIRVILKPLIERLLAKLRSLNQVEQQLTKLLLKLRETPGLSGYGGGNLLNLFHYLGTDLAGYDFSQLKIHQADLQEVALHRVNFAQAEFLNCTFAATFGGITSVAFSPDGHLLATSDTHGEICIWSVTSGQQVGACQGHNSWVWQVVFSPNNQILASCGQDHTIRLWNSQTGELLKTIQGHTSIVTDIAFSADARQVASSSEDQSVKLWEVETGRCLQTFLGHEACVWSVAFHPIDRLLVSAGEDNAIKVWDLETNHCVQTLMGHQRWIKAIEFADREGTLLASGSLDGTIKLWNLHTGDCLKTLTGHQSAVVSLALSSDEQILASGSYDQTVKLWNLQTGACIKTLQKHTNRVWSVNFHPHKNLLASGGDDHAARLWDTHTGRCTKTFQGHSNSIYTIALSPNDHLLASGHEDQTIKLWKFDRRLRTQPFKVLRGHTNRVFSIAFSPDGERLVSASADRSIKLWNACTGQCLHTFQGHISWVWGVAFSPDGHTIASASYDQTIKLWNVETGECVQTLEEHTSSVLAVAFSSDGRWLASGGYDQTIKLWDVSTGECFLTLEAHDNRVWSVAFSSDTQQLATCGDDQTIKLWQISTGKCLQTLRGHTSQVLSVLFYDHDSKLISSSADTTLRHWDVSQGDCLETLQGHQNWVWSIALDSQCQTLLSGSHDETIQYWDLTTGKNLQRLQAPRPYEGMDITGAIGLTEAQKASLLSLGAIERE